jgi:hypothetical protein
LKYFKLFILFALSLLFDGTASSFAQTKVYTIEDLPKTYTEKEVAIGWKIFDQNIGDGKDWKLKRDKKGVKVYIRKVSLSPICAFMGITELETDLSTLVAFITNPLSCAKYMQYTNHAEILKQFSETEFISHTINKVPWPLKPRDVVALNKWSQNPETLAVSGKALSLSQYIPFMKGYIRCPLILTEFRLRPLDNGNIEFAMESIVEIGGWVPIWLINFSAVHVPYSSIQKIRKLMPFDEKYKTQEVNWLKLSPAHQKNQRVFKQPVIS